MDCLPTLAAVLADPLSLAIKDRCLYVNPDGELCGKLARYNHYNTMSCAYEVDAADIRQRLSSRCHQHDICQETEKKRKATFEKASKILAGIKIRTSGDRKLMAEQSWEVFVGKALGIHLLPELAAIVVNYSVEIHLWIQWNPGPLLKASERRPPSTAQLCVRDDFGNLWPLTLDQIEIDVSLFRYIAYHFDEPQQRQINTNNLVWLSDDDAARRQPKPHHLILLQAPPHYIGKH